MADLTMTRRRFLATSGAAVTLTALPLSSSPAFAPAPSIRETVLAAVFEDIEAACRFARSLTFPVGFSPAPLLAETMAAGRESDAVRALIGRLIAHDRIEERFQLIDGWVLTETEARLLAIAATPVSQATRLMS